MRIWDIQPQYLCRQHLLGEHRELHAVWSILVNDKSGYRNHPEVKRWAGKLRALYKRHTLLVGEMDERGYKHSSPLAWNLATGSGEQKQLLNKKSEQKEILQAKKCPCPVG